MAWWQQLGWSALFALMLLVATGGNAIVLWIVLGELPSIFSLSLHHYLHLPLVILLSFLQANKNILRGQSPRANHTDKATAACWRS
jgi:hypothetical protein